MNSPRPRAQSPPSKTDVSSLPHDSRAGAVAKTQAEVEPPVETAPEPKPVKKKPRRQRVPVENVEEPTVDLYDYPFEERIIEERPAPVTAEPSEFHEYSFDLPGDEVEYHSELPVEGDALVTGERAAQAATPAAP